MQTIIKITAVIFIGLLASCGNDARVDRGLKIENRILDRVGLLTEIQKDSIFNVIKNLDEEIGSQIAVLIIDTLGKEKLEEFSLRMAETLKLGRPTLDDGLLITVVVVERKIRIEVGRGLESIVKDEIAGRIIADYMSPNFREEKYGKGIYTAVDKISKLIIDNEDLVGQEFK